jgi:hypothetical protein
VRRRKKKNNKKTLLQSYYRSVKEKIFDFLLASYMCIAQVQEWAC